MHSRTILFAASALFGFVAAQTQQVFNYTVDLSQVDLSRRAEWCRGERSVCGSLCGSDFAKANECIPETLTYSCICANGTEPGLIYYKNSLPTFLCEEAFKQCNAANVGNSQGQMNCRTQLQNRCGTLDASTANTGSGSTSTTASGTAAPTQSGAQSPATSSSSRAVAAPTQVPNLAGVAAAAAMLGAAVARNPLW